MDCRDLRLPKAEAEDHNTNDNTTNGSGTTTTTITSMGERWKLLAKGTFSAPVKDNLGLWKQKVTTVTLCNRSTAIVPLPAALQQTTSKTCLLKVDFGHQNLLARIQETDDWLECGGTNASSANIVRDTMEAHGLTFSKQKVQGRKVDTAVKAARVEDSGLLVFAAGREGHRIISPAEPMDPERFRRRVNGLSWRRSTVREEEEIEQSSKREEQRPM